MKSAPPPIHNTNKNNKNNKNDKNDKNDKNSKNSKNNEIKNREDYKKMIECA